MRYVKPAISIQNQIAILAGRGLSIRDQVFAETHLSRISYYRLRAYTYPFQNNLDPNHPFTKKVSFEQIIQLYDFDHRLRVLIFSAMEKIEISMRTQIIYNWAMTYGSHWHNNPNLYRDPVLFAKHITSVNEEVSRGKEAFIEHYLNKYTIPPEPPSWMSLEVASFGLLSQIFLNLKSGNEKKAVTRYFGLKDVTILENWMYCFSSVRNICAHHGRLWNRRLTANITFPKSPMYDFVTNLNIAPYKLYAAVSCMVYVMNIICPGDTFKEDFLAIMESSPFDERKAVGFPTNWEKDPFWK